MSNRADTSREPFPVTPRSTRLADLAQPELAEEGYVGDFGPDVQALIFREGMLALTASGILGDARGARRAGGPPDKLGAADPWGQCR